MQLHLSRLYRRSVDGFVTAAKSSNFPPLPVSTVVETGQMKLFSKTIRGMCKRKAGDFAEESPGLMPQPL